MQSIAQLFNNDSIPTTAVVPVRGPIEGVCATAYPDADPHYYFDENLLKKLIRFFVGTPARRNLLFIGDSGVGKSSLIEQVATRLGWPVFSIACSGRMRMQHFVGSFDLKNGETRWRDGPLVQAMRCGGVFLADEITRLDHSEQMALAKVLDSGATITIPDTGEVIKASPQFRFCATGNSGGFGDESGAYNGERVSSVAFLDRFQKIKLDYMPADQELALLKRVTASAPAGSQLGDDILTAMIKLANDVRKAFVSRGGDLRTVISTRSLCIWSLETIGYHKSCKNPLEEALADTILNGCPPNDVQVISELWSNWIASGSAAV